MSILLDENNLLWSQSNILMKAENIWRKYIIYICIISDFTHLFFIYFTYIIADKTKSCKYNHIT
jgi:hypothetical protein